MGNPSPKRRLFHGHWVTVCGSWAGGGTSTRQAMGRVYRRAGAGQRKRLFCIEISIRRALPGFLQVSRWPRWSLEAWTGTVVLVQITDRGIGIYKVHTSLRSAPFFLLRCTEHSVSRDKNVSPPVPVFIIARINAYS